MQGIVERIRRDRQRGHIRGDDGRAFDFEPQALEGTTFDALLLGTKVEFSVREPAGGNQGENPHAVHIHVAAERPSPVHPEALPPEDKSEPDISAAQSQVPPRVVKDDVDEGSWESFPASDPPAKHETT